MQCISEWLGTGAAVGVVADGRRGCGGTSGPSARLGMTVGVVCKAGAGLLATRGPSTLVGTTGGR
jgi:hypothetical protein